MSIRELEKATGLKFESLRRLYNNETTRYPSEVIGRICEVLKIDISDLLILVDNNNDNKEKSEG
ncbi:helix-turn-helix domain-containing protein [Parageobacillus thermoglucosidasius]|uniref:helix-turn-helix domain-containing protein n=1 Tax=Parageobacillus thermoglucosidasius TaxID=1426 RepID=UPI003519FE67